MNVNQLEELKAALTLMEGSGISSCWNDYRGGECTLEHALAKYNSISDEKRKSMDGMWYECVYGNGGWHRYFVNLTTGEVTFSAHHSRPERIKQALSLGFRLH